MLTILSNSNEPGVEAHDKTKYFVSNVKLKQKFKKYDLQ